jgi:energy-coupling factor transporter transmembrane protein EcfT
VENFKLTPRMRIALGIWLVGLVALVIVAVLANFNDTVEAGVLGGWCGIAIAAVMVMLERGKKQPTTKLARERYGRR